MRIGYMAVLTGIFLCFSGCGSKKEEKPRAIDTAELARKMEETGSAGPAGKVEKNKPAEPVRKHPGEAVYKAYCITCHMGDGSGVPGMYPPLTPNIYIEDKEKLISVLLEGMTGKIEVNGQVYNNFMAPHGHLSDEELAAVMSYVRSGFGNDLDPVTAEEVAAARKK